MSDKTFVQLHNHTDTGSLLDSAVDVEGLVERAEQAGMPAVAISDHGTMHSFVDFYKACKDRDIKPIFGTEFYITDDNMYEKNQSENRHHIVAWAKNKTGLMNLFKLITMANKDGFYYKPRIDWRRLVQHSEGLIVSTACLAGRVPTLLNNGQYKRAKEEALKYKRVFGNDFYLEIMSNKLDEQLKVNKELLKLSEEIDVKLIATNDVHYLDKNDYKAHDVLLAIQTKAKLKDKNRFSFSNNQFYFKNREEMKEGLFDESENHKRYWLAGERALDNTLELAGKIKDIHINLGDILFPIYDVPDEYTVDEFLGKVAFDRLNKLSNKENIDYERYRKRLEHELKVIKDKGYSAYFFIVADFIRYAGNNDILVGVGRGSAGGSLLSYLLGIIKIDPIRHGLLFSRFLNPQRDSMPDIDVDFPKVGREKIIQYVKDKYGEENVAQICTFGTMSTKAVLKDVGRALDIDFNYMNNKVVSAVPEEADDIQEALEISDKLAEYQDKNPELFEYATQLEDKPRHLGTHAAAVAITPRPVHELTPLARSKDDIVTQVEMHDAEELGLLKMDFLGLKTLDLIENTIDFIHNRDDLDKFDFVPTVDNIWDIPLDDNNVYQNIYQEADTNGVFQCESQLFKKLLGKMKPKKFEHIIAVLALGRPGPLEAGIVDDYLDRMHGDKEAKYPHPDLEDELEETYGFMIYQEQVMKTAQIIAGFSLGKADILRRAMGKKDDALMEKLKHDFIKGSIGNGHSKDFAEDMFELIEYFSGYGFNKCVSGDTMLERSSGNQHAPRKFTIKELYETWNSKTSTGKKYRNPNRGISILSFCNDGRVRPRQVKDVFKTGEKEVYKLKLKDGTSIKSTKDHKFMTSNKNWKRLEELEVGEQLLVKDEYQKTNKNYSLTKMEQNNNKDIDMAGHQGFYSGENNFGYINGAYMEFQESREIAYERSNGRCEICNAEEGRMEYHHKDGDRTNNSPENIKYLCNSCHKKEEYKLGRNKKWDKGYPVKPAKIVNIEYVGKEMTYDLEMYSDNEVGHNYIADDIVTHNSHSASYAMISYVTAWLKNYFPAEFYASLMTLESGKTPKDSKLNSYISDCYHKDIEILNPHINRSDKGFTADNGIIRFGLGSIKGIGEKASDNLLDNRPFNGLSSMYEEVRRRVVNKTVFEALIKSGALSTFSKDRNKLLDDYKKLRKGKALNMQLFNANGGTTKGEIIEYESDTLGMSVSYPSKWDIMDKGDKIKFVGELQEVSEITTKNNNLMCFAQLVTPRHKIKLVIFPRQYKRNKSIIKDNQEVLVSGEKGVNNSLVMVGIQKR